MSLICTTLPHQRAVLAGVLALAGRDQPAAVRRLNFLSLQLQSSHFIEPYQLIYRSLIVYLRSVQAVIKYEHFADLVNRRNLEQEQLSATISSFIELQNAPVPEESEFRYQVVRLKELTKTDGLTETLVDAMDVLQTGKRVGKHMLFGYDGAMAFLTKRLSELSRNEDGSDIAYTNKDATRVLTQYADRKYGRTKVYRTGFGEIDEACSGGFQRGDLVFIAGYTSEGKSTLLNTLVDGWVFRDKLNVVMGTAEHPPEVVQRRLVSIRSCDPKYGGVINYKKLKEGRLDSAEEKQLERIVADMATGDYGNYVIFTIKNGETITSVFNKVDSYNQIFPGGVDVFGWDYIGYTASEVKRDTDREEMGHNCRSAKVNSVAFNHNRGLVTVSPFQVSRGKWENAVKSGHYTLGCFEETSAAEKACDQAISVLQLGDKTVGQLLKNRDGPRYAQPFEMQHDPTGSRFVPKATANLMPF